MSDNSVNRVAAVLLALIAWTHRIRRGRRLAPGDLTAHVVHTQPARSLPPFIRRAGALASRILFMGGTLTSFVPEIAVVVWSSRSSCRLPALQGMLAGPDPLAFPRVARQFPVEHGPGGPP